MAAHPYPTPYPEHPDTPTPYEHPLSPQYQDGLERNALGWPRAGSDPRLRAAPPTIPHTPQTLRSTMPPDAHTPVPGAGGRISRPDLTSSRQYAREHPTPPPAPRPSYGPGYHPTPAPRPAPRSIPLAQLKQRTVTAGQQVYQAVTALVTRQPVPPRTEIIDGMASAARLLQDVARRGQVRPQALAEFVRHRDYGSARRDLQVRAEWLRYDALSALFERDGGSPAFDHKREWVSWEGGPPAEVAERPPSERPHYSARTFLCQAALLAHLDPVPADESEYSWIAMQAVRDDPNVRGVYAWLYLPPLNTSLPRDQQPLPQLVYRLPDLAHQWDERQTYLQMACLIGYAELLPHLCVPQPQALVRVLPGPVGDTFFTPLLHAYAKELIYLNPPCGTDKLPCACLTIDTLSNLRPERHPEATDVLSHLQAQQQSRRTGSPVPPPRDSPTPVPANVRPLYPPAYPSDAPVAPRLPAFPRHPLAADPATEYVTDPGGSSPRHRKPTLMDTVMATHATEQQPAIPAPEYAPGSVKMDDLIETDLAERWRDYSTGELARRLDPHEPPIEPDGDEWQDGGEGA